MGCSVKWRVILSTVRESFEYRGGGVLCKVEGNLEYNAGIF